MLTAGVAAGSRWLRGAAAHLLQCCAAKSVWTLLPSTCCHQDLTVSLLLSSCAGSGTDPSEQPSNNATCSAVCVAPDWVLRMCLNVARPKARPMRSSSASLVFQCYWGLGSCELCGQLRRCCLGWQKRWGLDSLAQHRRGCLAPQCLSFPPPPPWGRAGSRLASRRATKPHFMKMDGRSHCCPMLSH